MMRRSPCNIFYIWHCYCQKECS